MDELRIVLLGKQGAGKSASGNTLLRNKPFHTAASSEPVTEACLMSMSTVNGQTIKVIDTPGWCDSPRFETDIKQEIIKCINISHPGPHVFLLVLPIGRFTNEEIDTVMSILEEFGDEVNKYMIVLFTKGDDLEDRPIEDYLKEVQSNLKKIIQLCGNRYHVFNNRDKTNNHQVYYLLEKIREMVKLNMGKCFTTAMYQKVELCIEKDEQSEDKIKQPCRKEADNSVQDKSKSLSGSENGGRRNVCDAEEEKSISEERKEQQKEQQKSTQCTEHEGLKQRVREEGKKDMLDKEEKICNLKVFEELHKQLEKMEGQFEKIKDELEQIKLIMKRMEDKQIKTLEDNIKREIGEQHKQIGENGRTV